MLKHFHVKEEDAITVWEGDLRSVVTSIFEKMDVPAEEASLAADVLVSADLRGVASHGVSNMLRRYVEGYRSGEINPKPKWRIVREAPATATIDSDAGLGIIVAPQAMEVAIEKAKQTGVGMVTIGNARHMGMAAYHAMLALKHDMIGICMTGCPPAMLPTFGAKPMLGSNPIAVAAPAGEEPPFVFDGATTTVAVNKIDMARRLGVLLPAGWIGDSEGVPIMEPTPPPPLPTDGLESRPIHRLLPIGSTRDMGSHKGYGLACVVDIMTGILSGTGYGIVPGRPNFSHFVGAYSIEAFTDVRVFKDLMDRFLHDLKNTPPALGHERVMVAGQPEWETEQDRRVNGIPLHKEVIRWFRDISSELAIPCPF